MHENFVLVPADKASNNVIIVCKKYYLDVVIRELSSTSTYQEVRRSCDDIVLRHIKCMEQNGIVLQPEHEAHSTGCLNFWQEVHSGVEQIYN